MTKKMIHKLYYVGYPLMRGILYNVAGVIAEKLLRNHLQKIEIIIQAPRSRVREAFLSFEKYPQYFPAIEQVLLENESLNPLTVKWTVNLEGASLHWDDRVTASDDGALLRLTAVSGDFDKYDRGIEFRDGGDRTRVCCSLDIVFNLGLLNRITGRVITEKIVQFNEELLLRIKDSVEKNH